MIRDALRALLPKGNYCGLLMNRRLGTHTSTEADLLYAGTISGDPAAIIVECKNRSLEVDASAIVLPGDSTDERVDLVPLLERKFLDARLNLRFKHVRFLVVGRTQTAFVQQVTPDCIVVGQPIQKWIRDSNEVQDFSPLENAWKAISQGLYPLPHDSELVALLRELPRFAPWDDPAVIRARETMISMQSSDSELAYYEKDRLDELREQSLFLRQMESDIEDGWPYPDD